MANNSSTTSKKKKQSSSAKDFLGLGAILLGLVMLGILLIENYMGYTGLQRLLNKENEVQAKQYKKR